MATKSIPIKDICLDGGTQQRAVDDDVMKRYSVLIKEIERTKNKNKFPPVEIITDGRNNFMWDGFHRYFAHLRLGKKYIEAYVVNGTRREAIFLSFSANKKNAFPRQPGTVKGIVEKILKDEEWAKMPQSEIALYVGCTQQFVSKVQAELEKLSHNQLLDRTAKTGQKTGLSRSKSVKVKRGKSEYEMKVPERKVLDATGKEVPKHLVKYFERANEYRQLNRQVHAVYKICKDGKESGDLFYKYIKLSSLTAAFNTAKHNLKFAMPYAVCRYCGGDENNAECRACGGAGFVNEGMYKCTPRELK